VLGQNCEPAVWLARALDENLPVPDLAARSRRRENLVQKWVARSPATASRDAITQEVAYASLRRPARALARAE